MLKVKTCLQNNNLLVSCAQASSFDVSTLTSDASTLKGNEVPHNVLDENKSKRHCFEVSDLVQSAIARRFNQTDMEVAAKGETTLIDC